MNPTISKSVEMPDLSDRDPGHMHFKCDVEQSCITIYRVIVNDDEELEWEEVILVEW